VPPAWPLEAPARAHFVRFGVAAPALRLHPGQIVGKKGRPIRGFRTRDAARPTKLSRTTTPGGYPGWGPGAVIPTSSA
jgi:hypothetical protein